MKKESNPEPKKRGGGRPPQVKPISQCFASNGDLLVMYTNGVIMRMNGVSKVWKKYVEAPEVSA